ncbi:MAG: aminopeptidase [Candidatus Aenigmarchaeota archaeon]|nr:aminopeptidase [Candidatus Aenigmarchaeota archaeon]
MLTADMRKKLACRIVWAMNMRENETLSIRGGLHEQDLVEEIALTAMEQGVNPSFGTASDKYVEEFYDRIPVKYLRTVSKMSLKQAEVLDNSIGLERLKDPRIMEKVPPYKTAAAVEGAKPVSKLMDKRKVKWCYVGFPSEEMAKKFGISYSLLRKFILDGILVKQKLLFSRASFLSRNLKLAQKVHFWDEFGTDMTLRITGRKILIADGYISDIDKKHGDVGLNLPDGEVFLAPIETYGTGTLVAPKQMDRHSGKPIENIKLVFEDGKLNLKKSTADKNEKAMKDTILRSIAIDKKHETRVRTTNVAELGIGLNPLIDRAIGYTLTDEKIGGTIHVAIGYNKGAYGGRSESCLHWDFVTHKGITLEAELRNGKTKVLIEGGKILSR